MHWTGGLFDAVLPDLVNAGVKLSISQAAGGRSAGKTAVILVTGIAISASGNRCNSQRFSAMSGEGPDNGPSVSF